MTNDTRTADEIEREIEKERAQMSGTINDLQKKFSVESIVSDLGSMFKGSSSDFGRSISQTLGRNPAAVALMGVGLAWLALGQGRSAQGSYHDDTLSASDRARHNRNAVPADNWDDQLASTQGRDIFSRKASQDWLSEEPSGDWQSGAFAKRKQTEAGGLIGSVRSGAEAVTSAVSQATGTVRDAAADLTARLLTGTEGFSEEAKARVLAARRLAHEAQASSTAAVKRGGEVAVDLFRDQPLVVGGLAVALGAAVGGVLPRSRIENETLGAERDRLFAEAQRVFSDEQDKIKNVLQAATSEAKHVFEDAKSELSDMLPDGKSAGDEIVNRVTDAVSRVADGAKEEASRVGLLGDPQS
ncbi:MAG: DUF3618 domain-containing protein [Cypionkella sp.]